LERRTDKLTNRQLASKNLRSERPFTRWMALRGRYYKPSTRLPNAVS
jgi:hypothetical protein